MKMGLGIRYYQHLIYYYIINGVKIRVVEGEVAAMKMGLGIRLLLASDTDMATAKYVKFSSNCSKNRMRNKQLSFCSRRLYLKHNTACSIAYGILGFIHNHI
ncbi:hypothetical protein HanHA300_Chr02g0054631 [Helianthus annuus]|nr:hypothetical protein HanHA300_Chr02g0054631 [Helianthus annuus]KAJ0618837.1 hypothetical protein HanHA89_Chr02g0058111 [Helianthus annuus]KAJ0777294.1 hypothetical protein HanLR1_Chr02g0055731 [Helianthus annuus]